MAWPIVIIHTLDNAVALTTYDLQISSPNISPFESRYVQYMMSSIYDEKKNSSMQNRIARWNFASQNYRCERTFCFTDFIFRRHRTPGILLSLSKKVAVYKRWLRIYVMYVVGMDAECRQTRSFTLCLWWISMDIFFHQEMSAEININRYITINKKLREQVLIIQDILSSFYERIIFLMLLTSCREDKKRDKLQIIGLNASTNH